MTDGWLTPGLPLDRIFTFGTRVTTTRELVGCPRDSGDPSPLIPAGTPAEICFVRFYRCPYPYVISFDGDMYPDLSVPEDALTRASG